MTKYLTVSELLFEGYENCSSGYEYDEFDRSKEPYITIVSDESAECWRGANTIWYKGKEIAKQIMTTWPDLEMVRPKPTYGLYRQAEKWLLKNLTNIIKDYK